MEPIKIDGSFGEGGGQIIRSAITLSAITGKPVEVENIRNNRKIPGLRPQHTIGIKILSKICQAKTEGLNVGSTSLRFSPFQAVSAQITEDIGTAGSIPLVLQVLIPSVSLMKKTLKISIMGGTDVPWSPTSNYTKFVLAEAYSRIGINFSLGVKRRGYYPKGRGLIEAEIFPAKDLVPITFGKRTTKYAKLICSFSKLSREQILNEVKKAEAILEKNGFQCESSINEEDAIDKGCSLLVYSHDRNSVVGSDAIYERDLNGIGGFVAKKFVESDNGVDLFLSDMLVVPLSLIEETSVFQVKQITKHLETNLFVASKMTGCKYGIGKIDGGFEVRISGKSYS